MTSLIHIADRVLNRPLLITRDKAEVVLSVLAGRLGVNAPQS
ncbi:MAG: S49 family peptidase, partial [Mesorhizobium sp.]